MEQDDFLRYVLEQLEILEIRYAIVGSFASGVYGEPRFTQDVDIIVDLQRKHIGRLCSSFSAPDFYLSRETVAQAVSDRRQFNVIHPESGNKIDFLLSVHDDPWKSQQLERRRELKFFPDKTACFASPEDVILGKLAYYKEGGSAKHLRDITGIVVLRKDSLDLDYVRRFADHLAVTEIWESVLGRVENSDPNNG